MPKQPEKQHYDRLSQLPDDILLLILSSFPLKEAARTSVISHRWKHLWHCLPTLIFEDVKSSIIRKIKEPDELRVIQAKSRFISWVNHVVNTRRTNSSTIDEFKVIFYFDNLIYYDCYIDEWVDFAFKKHVKKLELNFRYIPCYPFRRPRYNLPVGRLPCYFGSLTSLCLQEVDVTSEAMEHILHFFPLLENMSIKMSYSLTRINGISLKLKYLEISDCDELETIHISTPQLLSFKLMAASLPGNLLIENASLLSEVSVGGGNVEGTLRSLFTYFPQLEYLTLKMFLCAQTRTIKEVRTLANLKHLTIEIETIGNESLLGWTPLIDASPNLNKLTLKESGFVEICPNIKMHNCDGGQPLRRLKTLEIIGFLGSKVDLELSLYVLGKALALKEVIVDFRVTNYSKTVREVIFAQKKSYDAQREIASRGKAHPHQLLVMMLLDAVSFLSMLYNN